MGPTFARARGAVAATFDEAEAELLRHLLEQLLTLLDDGDHDGRGRPAGPGGGHRYGDRAARRPALARLFPDGYADDGEAAGGVPPLHRGRAARAQARRRPSRAGHPGPGAGAKQLLDPQAAASWLRTLTDLRLVLGTRLEVTEDIEARLGARAALDEDDPRRGDVRGLRAGWAGCRRRWSARWLTGCPTLPTAPVDRAVYPCDVLEIDKATYDAIVAHARRDHPDEACGVVAGPVGTDRPERFIPMLNAARSPTFYEFDSDDLLRLYREMDDRDEEPVVDLPLAHRDRGLPVAHRHLLRLRARRPLRARVHRECGNDDGPVSFRSFRIVDGEITEEEVTVVPTLS